MELTAEVETEPRTQWELMRRRFFRHRVAVAAVIVLLGLLVVCFGASWFAFYPKGKQDLLLGPTGPSAKHWMGTDNLGIDQLTTILYAGQVSLKIGLAVALISTVIGTVIGATAGYFSKVADQLLMRVTDLFLVVPSIAVLAIALKKFGHTVNWIIIVLAALGWMYVARIVRGQVLSIKEKEFVEAARASGASSARIIARHILPNCIGPILVNATLAIAGAIITESTLSFLGFGIQIPDESWGHMLSSAEGNYAFNTHLLYFPGLMILLTVLCVNFLGDGLRDAFDPQSAH
ncbi:MAG: peptide/nickel transport system permease protein [Actinomycetota bacterium]|jgi:peptide/nickel transport system permease protein